MALNFLLSPLSHYIFCCCMQNSLLFITSLFNILVEPLTFIIKLSKMKVHVYCSQRFNTGVCTGGHTFLFSVLPLKRYLKQPT